MINKSDIIAKEKYSYIALGHCNITLGIILDSIYSLHGIKSSLEIINNLADEKKILNGRTYLHNDIETVLTYYKNWNVKDNQKYLLTGLVPSTKKKIFNFFYNKYNILENQYHSLIHSTAYIAHGVELNGAINISSGCVIAQYAKLDKFICLNRNVIIEHHTTIGEYTCIFSGANIAASCTIGKNVTIFTGVIIINGITIGDNVTIGAGSLVTRSIPANTTVYGVPAKIIKKTNYR